MPHYRYSKKILWHYIPNLTLSNEKPIFDFIESIPDKSRILDIGSGGVLLRPEIISFDKFITENTKVVGDIHHLPFKDASISGIICGGTLEHIEDPWAAVREFYRVLEKGGRLIVGVPFMQGYHPDPADYWRMTEEGLSYLCKDFKKIDSGVSLGSGSGLSWALIDFFRSLSDNRYISEGLGVLARFVFCFVKYFDVPLRKNKKNRLFASGFYFIGEK